MRKSKDLGEGRKVRDLFGRKLIGGAVGLLGSEAKKSKLPQGERRGLRGEEKLSGKIMPINL